jgi:transcription elongation GreA/GreB family factor
MRTRTIIILLVVAALLIAGVYGWNEYHRGNESLKNVTAAYTVKADELINEFEKSDAASEKKYLGKVLAVNGTVKQIDKDSDGNYTIVIGSSAAMSAVRCSMDSTISNELMSIKEGEEVAVKGTFTGYQKDETGLLGSDIQLNRAVLNSNRK